MLITHWLRCLERSRSHISRSHVARRRAQSNGFFALSQGVNFTGAAGPFDILEVRGAGATRVLQSSDTGLLGDTSTALNEPLPNVNRSGIGTLALTFDLPVNVQSAGSLKLFNHTTGTPVDVSTAALLNNGTPLIGWDVTSLSLPGGRYTAEVAIDQVTTTVGGPLQPTHSFEFHKLAGDVDGDALVNFNDYFAVRSQFDTSGDPYRPGDADGDGLVNFNDYFAVRSNFDAGLAALTYDFGDAPTAAQSGFTTSATASRTTCPPQRLMSRFA